MKKIFILNDQKIEGVTNIPLLNIRFLPQNINIKHYDALIFTSKNAIYSLNSFNKDWKKIPSYAIAKKTQKIIEEEGGITKFVGKSSHGDSFAHELKDLLANKKTLYIRAKKVVSNLVQILKDNQVIIDELITYETSCNKLDYHVNIPENSIIIFSSPSTIKCFFDLYIWDSSYQAICIGRTTATYLPEGINSKISPSQSLSECIKYAKSFS
ncbi:uroporphyrinogen III synthase [Arcobacter sp. 31_11_sub10_T18]|nr:uroporphyrinogen III synthase [Arcobacter sp. 31_11_sub10_T18]